MDDLISRQAAIDAVTSLCDNCDSGYCGSCRVNYPGEKDARKALEDLPPAQPEIVRCKDCKHYVIHILFGHRQGWCERLCDEYDKSLARETGDNDFCSKGERRTDNVQKTD